MTSPQKSDVRPWRLRADALTPPARTPWGGDRIRALKGLSTGPPVGESWELSVEPSFPSHTEGGVRLSALIECDRESWLGQPHAEGTTLLVKLLDAAEPLSVQIHPRDGDPALSERESGKPEAWYVVEADAGAGLYVGWVEGVDAVRVRRAIEAGEDLSRLLHFVPVCAGDYFVIEAGTPHCIGPGVFLVEPQRVQPGRTGTTYRYWDWNRRYDEAGRPDPQGSPRRLDLERALAVTRWDLPRGDALLHRIRHRGGAPDGGARAEELVAPRASTPLRTARLSGTGAVAMPFRGQLRAVTVLAGSVELGGVRLDAGQTAAVPAAFEGDADMVDAHATVCACDLALRPS